MTRGFENSRLRRFLERFILVLGILSFWPWILGYRGLAYRMALMGMVVILAGLAVSRARRVKRALEHRLESTPGADARAGGERPSPPVT